MRYEKEVRKSVKGKSHRKSKGVQRRQEQGGRE